MEHRLTTNKNFGYKNWERAASQKTKRLFFKSFYPLFLSHLFSYFLLSSIHISRMAYDMQDANTLQNVLRNNGSKHFQTSIFVRVFSKKKKAEIVFKRENLIKVNIIRNRIFCGKHMKHMISHGDLPMIMWKMFLEHIFFLKAHTKTNRQQIKDKIQKTVTARMAFKLQLICLWSCFLIHLPKKMRARNIRIKFDR